jgi:hypothetical protein
LRVDQALELVRVTSEAGLNRLLGLVVVDQRADGLSGVARERGDLVGGDLRVRRGRDIALADPWDVADADSWVS